MTTDEPQYKAMQMLTELAPRIRGREPYWRPAAPSCAKLVHLPAWTWIHPHIDPTATEIVSMDVNGAYLAACSSAVFAHGALEHRGGADPRIPGYYLVDAHPWTCTDIVSPLGTAAITGERVWVAHPTAALLFSLVDDGYWPDVTVHDAWTSRESMRLRSWTDAVKADRAAALRGRALDIEGAAQKYEAIKDGYSIAVQLMKGPAPGGKVKSPVRRPDWYATVHAQHAASTWRKAWSTLMTGHGPVAMGSVDEVTWTAADVAALMARTKPVIRIDLSGQQIGAFKMKVREGEPA